MGGGAKQTAQNVVWHVRRTHAMDRLTTAQGGGARGGLVVRAERGMAAVRSSGDESGKAKLDLQGLGKRLSPWHKEGDCRQGLVRSCVRATEKTTLPVPSGRLYSNTTSVPWIDRRVPVTLSMPGGGVPAIERSTIEKSPSTIGLGKGQSQSDEQEDVANSPRQAPATAQSSWRQQRRNVMARSRCRCRTPAPTAQGV